MQGGLTAKMSEYDPSNIALLDDAKSVRTDLISTKKLIMTRFGTHGCTFDDHD